MFRNRSAFDGGTGLRDRGTTRESSRRNPRRTFEWSLDSWASSWVGDSSIEPSVNARQVHPQSHVLLFIVVGIGDPTEQGVASLALLGELQLFGESEAAGFPKRPAASDRLGNYVF